MSETKTPRTDKIMQLVYSIASVYQIQDYPEIEAKPFVDRVMSETSQLETELNEARAEIERLKKTAEIETILAVTDMYYVAKCNHCGWVGSSKLCVEARAGCADDCGVLCPLCFRHISDDEPSLKDVAEFLNRDVIKIVERRDKQMRQARQALEEIVACGGADSEDAQEVVIAKAALEVVIAKAALEAAEKRGEQ